MARAYWLVKSEPSVYSWSKLVAEGTAVWDGVRNFEARNNLRAMKKGDLVVLLSLERGEGRRRRRAREARGVPGPDDGRGLERRRSRAGQGARPARRRSRRCAP